MAAKLPKGRHHSAIKETRKTKKHYLHNRSVKKKIHSLVKKFELAGKEKNQNAAKEALSQIFKVYDKAAKRRIIHPRTVARKKSRLSHRYNTLFSTAKPKN